jgi:hypothetical protein
VKWRGILRSAFCDEGSQPWFRTGMMATTHKTIDAAQTISESSTRAPRYWDEILLCAQNDGVTAKPFAAAPPQP